MSETPKLFISFSSRDQARIRKLFAALEIQEISVWDYSDQGQELIVGRDLLASLTETIDLCEYFIAIVSPSSIDKELSKASYLEVRHAIDAGKLAQKRILPVLVDNPSSEWLSLYPELEPILRITLEDDSEERVEDAIRRICDWLKVSYAPSSLQDNRVFFTKLFLEEIHGEKLGNADFVQLLRIMNSCARRMLADDWEGAKEKTSLFLSLVREMVPEATFQYPLVIKGVCELQLKQFENAERTFLQATTNHDITSNPLLGLGYAGLGHTYAAQQRFDESLLAFQKAVEQDGADEYLRFNHQVAIFSGGGLTLDESVLDGFDLTKLSPEERGRLITLKGALHYRSGNFSEAIRAFGDIDYNDLDEASAIYYSLALQENGEAEKAFEILSFVAGKTKSTNLFHHLADAYLKADDLFAASSIYEERLCDLTTPSDYARQLLIEYAQIVRVIKGINSAEIRRACNRVVNFEVFPPPQSKADCFFTGFAYYFLGNEVLARHYYAISSGFCPQYYDECIRFSSGQQEMSTVMAKRRTEEISNQSSGGHAGRPRRPPLLSDLTMMWLLLVAGFVILIGGGGARILLDHWNMLPGLIKNGLNPVVLMGTSYYCFYYSKRYYARMMGATAADELMKADPRPPVLYLRPFMADDKEGAPRWLHLETQEEKLASVFMKIGPFVALGKPQEKFPTLGAARTYVEGDWETAVSNVMARAWLVVVRAGNGRALSDEVERATREVRPQQLLIIVPSGRKNYEAFCANVGHCFPRPLPTYPSWKTSRTRIKGLICFDSDWTPRFLTFGHRFLRGSIFNPLPRALQATLRPACERLGIPWRSPSINWVRLGFIGLLALAVFYGLYEEVKLN